MAENMPSSTAQRPGDVLTQYGGKTIEVLNTDAEGRLILADAIVRATRGRPRLPHRHCHPDRRANGRPGHPDARRDGHAGVPRPVAERSRAVGENGWAMPLPTELRADLSSRVADMANVTAHKYGGMLSAATYLGASSSPPVRLAHVDIAGPGVHPVARGDTPRGGTGVPVRSLIAVIERIAETG